MDKLKVKNVLLTAAAELGIYDVVKNYMDGISTDASDTQTLLRCFNLVENELAVDYLPLYAEEEVETETGAVYYTEFSRTPIRIVAVHDAWDNEMPFRLFPDYLKTQGGKLKIRYAYEPVKKTLEGESDYVLQSAERLLAYGIATEYSLALGLFEEAAVWDKKYKEAVAIAYRTKPNRVLQSRRWV